MDTQNVPTHWESCRQISRDANFHGVTHDSLPRQREARLDRQFVILSDSIPLVGLQSNHHFHFRPMADL